MNDTTQSAPSIVAVDALPLNEAKAYRRAEAKLADPNAKPLTEKEHAAFDLVHGEGTAAARVAEIVAVAGRERPLTQAEQIRAAMNKGANDGMTDEERAAIAAEAKRKIDDQEDPALFRADAARRGSAGANVIVDNHELAERAGGDTVADSIAASRRALEHTDQRTSATLDRQIEARVWNNPAPFDESRPSAPLQVDGEAPLGFTMDRTESTRPRVDSSELAASSDELDVLLGSSYRRERVSFDMFRDRATGFRHVFARHYDRVGVLVDRYASASTRVAQEIADKQLQIERYNSEVAKPEEQIGYLAYVAGTELTYDDVRPALERKVCLKLVMPSMRGEGETLAPNVIHNLSQMQVLATRGSQKTGERLISMGDGRERMAAYFWDQRNGVHSVAVDGVVGTGRNREEAEASARALSAATEPQAAAV